MKSHSMQDVDLIGPQVINIFKKKPSTSLSFVFRVYRKNLCYSSIGDFPILATIINSLKKISYPLDRKKTLYALNQSQELRSLTKKDKQELLVELLKPMSVGSKRVMSDQEDS